MAQSRFGDDKGEFPLGSSVLSDSGLSISIGGCSDLLVLGVFERLERRARDFIDFAPVDLDFAIVLIVTFALTFSSVGPLGDVVAFSARLLSEVRFLWRMGPFSPWAPFSVLNQRQHRMQLLLVFVFPLPLSLHQSRYIPMGLSTCVSFSTDMCR